MAIDDQGSDVEVDPFENVKIGESEASWSKDCFPQGIGLVE